MYLATTNVIKTNTRQHPTRLKTLTCKKTTQPKYILANNPNATKTCTWQQFNATQPKHIHVLDNIQRNQNIYLETANATIMHLKTAKATKT